MQKEWNILPRTWCDCFVCHVAAQTERVCIQLVFDQKGEEALMRTRALVGTRLRKRSRVSYCGHGGDAHKCMAGQEGHRSRPPYFSPFTKKHQWLHTHTYTHNFSATSDTSPAPSHLFSASLWQRQQLSDISFHYRSTPCLHHCSALDEARSTVNCQAELIGTWGRRWEWLGNWNELEWKKRRWEWEDLETQCSFDPSEVFFFFFPLV